MSRGVLDLVGNTPLIKLRNVTPDRGASTGLNVAGAIEIAKEMEPRQRVVTLACDRGLKYIGVNIYT